MTPARLLIAAAAVIAQAHGAAAQPAAMFGGWRADAPGVAHRITPADLPAPYASGSRSNSPSVTARPAGAAPHLPPGFIAEPWASGLDMPRVIRTAPNGDAFLAESGSGRVTIFHVGADGRAGPKTTFASGLSLPFGIAFWPPADPRFVYVAATDQIVRYPYAAGDGVARGPAETVVSGLPQGGHWTRDLAAAPDGSRLFVSVGSLSNVASSMPAHPPAELAADVSAWEQLRGLGAGWGNEAGRADVLQFEPAGHALHPFATGLRNCVGLAVQPASGALWCATNERDGLGDDLPPDYATRVGEGAFYGWPWYYIGAHEDPRLRGRRPDLAGRVTVPDVLIQPHSAPLGIAFYDGAMFPPEYRGDAFVTLHGSWNRGQRTGYKVIRLRLDHGRPTGSYEDFMTGFVTSDDAVWARPVGLAVLGDGSLVVTEDGNGTIWRVSYRH